MQEDYDRVGSIDIADSNGATIKDITFVKKLNGLTNINLTNQPLSDLKPLVNCKSLSNITLFNFKNEISIQGLESLENLVELIFMGTVLNKKPENTFSKMKGIKTLTIAGYSPNQKQFLNWDFLQTWTKIETLQVDPRTDFQKISLCKSLKHLKVFLGNHGIVLKLPNLDQFNNFQHLEKLEIRFHSIKRNISDDYLNQLRAMLPNTEVVVTGG